ncbi:hypothetical protein F4692_002912 [Nocardioides cavernae]|uniref:Exo-alpha-sialidase n=1 Tax=Nocardioides cavernae TaxID=1921566 RepID=A0A7Y9H5Q8_9ACTN|nr:hypothetical protein [Nocardioides cavernae]NYE37779.1 hypothetical protein [Nocardioides cavernae]
MSRITGMVVALTTAAAVLTTPTSQAAPPAAHATASAALPAAASSAPLPTAALPRDIPGGVELTMSDGDRLRLWATERYRAVVSRRWDAATGTWGPRRDVVRNARVRCGAVDARTANGAVAAIALCDEGGYYEDTAPVASRALWSPDGVTWSSHRLDGEAYEEPGISPDGQNAVWPMHRRYTTRTPAGWSDHAVRARGQEYTVTATITDTQQVSFLYGGQVGERCPLVVLTGTGDAVPVRQEVALGNACSSEADLVNVDADTALFGYLPNPALVAVVSRPDAASPWSVTRVAPTDAPGLERVERRLSTQFFTAPGLPLVAVGSADGRQVRAQVYDEAAQAWGPAATVHDAGDARCRWGDTATQQPLDVLVVALECGRRHLGVVLTTRDAATWQALRSGVHPLGVSDDGRYVAVPGRSRTWVVSGERGVVTLPGGVRGACDVVVPDGPDGAVLLATSGGRRGWPDVLSHSSAEGWSRLSRTRLPALPGRCSEAQASFWGRPVQFQVLGTRDRGYTLRIAQRDGQWVARASVW